jgi:hypothetical protein
MKKKGSGFLPFMFLCLFIYSALRSCGNNSSDDDVETELYYYEEESESEKFDTEPEETELEEETETETELEEHENSLSDYFDGDMSDAIMDLLENDIGFDGIRFVEKDNSLENYYFVVDNYYLTITAYADDGVYTVYLKNNMDYEFYNIDDGVIMTYAEFKDKTITDADMSYYYSMVQEAIESTLVNPSSAKFAKQSEISYQKKGDIVAIKGTVTAKNRMNAKVTSDFIVEIQVYSKESFSYDVLYMEMDGETSGTWVDLD